MDKAITTSLLIAISMVMVMLLFNSTYPAIQEGGDAIRSLASREEDRMRTQISVIHASGELDASGWWQDTNGNGVFDVIAWVKNIGDTRIIAFDQMDVFFGPEGNFVRIPHESVASSSYPYWSGTLEGETDWAPRATLRIEIHQQTPLGAGRYYLKTVLPNGIESDYYLGM